jgi:hypothetical protein
VASGTPGDGSDPALNTHSKAQSKQRMGGAAFTITDWGATHYEYDNLDRLTAVVKTDGTRLQYTYAPGEPSLVARAHSEYAGKWDSSIDAGPSFKSALAIYGTRTSSVSLGVVGVGSGAFIFAAGEYDEYLSPSAAIELPLHNLRLEHLLNHEEKEFYAPSNAFFLPAEYATLNCCICPGSDGPAMTDQPCMRCYPDPPDPPVPTRVYLIQTKCSRHCGLPYRHGGVVQNRYHGIARPIPRTDTSVGTCDGRQHFDANPQLSRRF